MLQRIDLIGNLVADAEIKTGKDGNEFISFRIAVTDLYGEEKRTTYYEVTCPKTKSIENLKKGNLIFVSGRPSLSAICKDGKAYLNAYINASMIRFVSAPRS